MKRLLIGSNGGLTGVYLARQFRKNSSYEIWGADCGEFKSGKFFVHKQLEISRATGDTFITELLDILNKGVDYYIPTHSSEIKIISKNEDYIRNNTNCKFLVSPYKTYEALDSKEDANYNLSKVDIPVPRMINEWDGTDVVMKCNIGSGGSGLIHIDNEKLFDAYKENSNSVAFYEMIKGEEYTVDCFFDKNGKLIAFNNRKRIKNIGGAVVVTKNESNDFIELYIKKIASSWIFKGCVNFQYILSDNVPYFIDVNLRFPSGGLPITVESGMNIPEWYISCMDGDTIVKSDKRADNMVMYRYYCENYDNN